MVAEWTDLNNRYASMPRPPGQATTRGSDFARTAGDLARIEVPTLLIWSADDRETTVADHALAALAALKTTDKHLVVIPRCGHILPLECGAAALRPTLEFLKRIDRAGAGP